MNHFVYILYSQTLDNYYIGSTSNIEERLKEHLTNHKGFTARAKDWILVYFEKFENKSEALQRELQIKRWKSRSMIESLLNRKE